MPNRLSKETSPYLRQHAGNPVDWYPWGPEALARARAEDRPIFLSIGYSACHWCHVMEHESFENPAIAEVMNEHFINVKVDREERPDLDAIYMQATMIMNDGSGGWPMSVFLTPDLKPFFAGTYFPPDSRYGRPGFPTILEAVSTAFRTRRQEIEDSSAEITDAISKSTRLRVAADGERIDEETFVRGVAAFSARFDSKFGGNLGAPKFPPSMTLGMLLRAWKSRADEKALSMARLTLSKMGHGGMYDQLGGGFSRYSVDERWAVPHFEKMLYDNAQLIGVYAEGFAATGDSEYRRIAMEIVGYLEREMTSPEGAFYSSQDADSEGEEGKFFSWTPAEFREVLGADSDFAMRAYGVTAAGNFEHDTTVLSLPQPMEKLAELEGMSLDAARALLGECRCKLFAWREDRIKPHRDEKVLTSWNGLMMWGLARAERAARLDGRAAKLARGAADFLLANMFTPGGRLLAVHAQGGAKLPAYLDCHAYLAAGLMELAAIDGDARYVEAAGRLLDLLHDHFADAEGGYFFTADDHERLIVRTQDPLDNATPSGNAMAALALLHMHEWTGEAKWRERADGILGAFAGAARRYPVAFPQMLVAAEFAMSEIETVVIAGDGAAGDAMEAACFEGFHPHRIVIRSRKSNDHLSILAGKSAPDGEARAYACRGKTCAPPVESAERLRKFLVP